MIKFLHYGKRKNLKANLCWKLKYVLLQGIFKVDKEMRNRVYSLLLVGAGIAILIASTILFNASVDSTNQVDSHTALSEKEKPLDDNAHLVGGLATLRDVTDHAEEQGWYIWIKLDDLIESLHDSSSTWDEICARTSKTELQMWKNNRKICLLCNLYRRLSF